MRKAKQRLQLHRKTRPPAPLHIPRLALYVIDSTPSEMASGQEWESPGGAVAAAVAPVPPRRHLCLCVCFRSGSFLLS